jgi:hypothetical protein
VYERKQGRNVAQSQTREDPHSGAGTPQAAIVLVLRENKSVLISLERKPKKCSEELDALPLRRYTTLNNRADQQLAVASSCWWRVNIGGSGRLLRPG